MNPSLAVHIRTEPCGAYIVQQIFARVPVSLHLVTSERAYCLRSGAPRDWVAVFDREGNG